MVKEDERLFLRERLKTEQGEPSEGKSLSFKGLMMVFKDFKIFLGGLMYFGRFLLL